MQCENQAVKKLYGVAMKEQACAPKLFSRDTWCSNSEWNLQHLKVIALQLAFFVSGEKSNQFCHKGALGLSLSKKFEQKGAKWGRIPKDKSYCIWLTNSIEAFSSFSRFGYQKIMLFEDNSKEHCICCMQ